MSKPTTLRISAPFDARHVGGVSIPGATNPLRGTGPAPVPLEPDETPSHTFAATGNIEVPRRSNSIASSLSKPSLRLKTSLSLLRGRSQGNSPSPMSAHQNKKEGESPMEYTNSSPHHSSPVQSVRKGLSSSRRWQRIHRDEPTPVTSIIPPTTKAEVRPLHAEMSTRPLAPVPSRVDLAPPPKATPHEYRVQPLLESTPTPPPKPPKTQPVRPRRADSGTAIDLDGVSPSERPLGFQQIRAVPSLAERMALYKKTREYWATADHGLTDWVEKSRHPRKLPLFA
ncbi:hypothetical protein DM02DRAFT_327085 [Periconia macrospinosa]|uniref:Uncharacterized protein n=1 Tax=Periconia macrospinosa TaxID=97972 RepID=A0A2V1EBB6_9PLEO|nr:hypothetical protein DM02DRAFT_327085 [Periconia macrospinosa]